MQACAHAGVAASWVDWDQKSPESPMHIRGYGSPTILVNGRDVADAASGSGEDSCRLYPDGADGFRGLPAVDQVVAALMMGEQAIEARGAQAPFGWRRLLAVVPGVGASLLPVASCPACWLASTGLLASVGLGFVADERVLLPVTVAFLGAPLASLGYRARPRRGYRPLDVMAVGIILTGKFWLASDTLLSLGVAMFIGVSLWNAWPQKTPRPGCCAACAPQEPEVKPWSAHNKERTWEPHERSRFSVRDAPPVRKPSQWSSSSPVRPATSQSWT